MALDGIAISCLAAQFKDTIIDGRIDKVYQPEPDEITLSVRTRTGSHRILLSASSNNPRLYITRRDRTNPAEAPLFCMLLRKHIQGGRIRDIIQPDFERIVEFSIDAVDELGQVSTKRLIIEIMGRHSNIILVNRDGTIIDAIKRISSTVSRVREVLPGRTYNRPPSQGKANPLTADKAAVLALLSGHKNRGDIAKHIMNSFTGVSSVTAREIVFRCLQRDVENSCLTDDDLLGLAEGFIKFFDEIKKESYSPCIVLDEQGRPREVSAVALEHMYPLEQTRFQDISMALETFYHNRDRMDRIKQKTASVLKTVNTHLDRSQKKLGKLLDELNSAKDGGIYKLYGELITANLYRIPTKASTIVLENFFDNMEPVEIPLKNNLTPAQNAQRYFKKYNKCKTAVNELTKQIKASREEIAYLEGQVDNLGKCTHELEVEEIKEELAGLGYIRKGPAKKRTGAQKKSMSTPIHYITSSGRHIYVGKNNKQNDYLTLQQARPQDLWFHVKDIPGSHVILKAEDTKPDEDLLALAAMIAAFYSKARYSSKVAVDYTLKKYVKKPRGAKPGMVIYENHKTLYVTPDEKTINSLARPEPL
ncbi:MAG: Rqc2 family fibronectin-binding protein [Mahellales bacterium]|jgi:predicted ribosome quality control (RQC) complex YloA/Tae2 family protein